MTQYRDEVHATVRALNCGEGRPVPAKWQQQYTAGYRESHLSADDLTPGERMLADAITHSLLHASLTSEQYSVLVLKYSGDDKARIKALQGLMPVVGTDAGPATKALSIGAWAGYKAPNADYDQQGKAESTVRGWRNTIRRRLDKLHDEALTAAAVALTVAGLVNEGY